jgi:putative ABC transport system permease protein
MTTVASFRLAARLARREVRRRPWRTLLVALLVAVPVAGMATAAAFVRTDHQTPAEEWRLQWGKAEVVVGPSEAASLPAGSRTASWRATWTGARTVDGKREHVEVLDLPMEHDVVADVMQVMEGRAPRQPGEAFLTRHVADEFGVGVGDELLLDRPLATTLRVTGVGERRAWWGSSTIVVVPGTPFTWDSPYGPSQQTVAADLPDDVTPAILLALGYGSAGYMVAPWLLPSPAYQESANEAVAWSWVIGAVVLTVVGIVIASAFAAGARRQLATLGQLAANGAQPSVLRRVLFLQGTWTGVLGTVLGLALGAVALAALAPHADRILSRDADPWRLRPVDFVPVVLLGIGAATVAAMVPARSTSRVPVLAALAGRRPLGRVPGWVTGAGVAAVAAGLGLLALAVLGATGATGDSQVWVLTAILGGLAILLGACAVTPAYTSVLERVAVRAGGAWRFAARSLVRQRTRSSAVVSAVCASGALAVLASALVLGFEAEELGFDEGLPPTDVYMRAWELPVAAPDEVVAPRPPVPRPVPDDLLEKLRAEVPGAAMLRLTAAQAGSRALGHPDAIVADDAARRVYGWSEAMDRALRQAGAVRLGHDELGFATADGIAAPVVAADDVPLGPLPRLLVRPDSLERFGLASAPGPVLVRADDDLTDRQRDRIADIVEDYRFDLQEANAGRQLGLDVNVEWPYDRTSVNPLLLEAALAGTALVFTLFVVATGLALAAAETRDERDVLTVLGASPATMRSTSGRKAALLAVLGGALAVPVGFLPVVVFTVADEGGLPLVFPWRVVLLLVVAVPLVAAGVTTAGSALALRMRPVRISTMAFD